MTVGDASSPALVRLHGTLSQDLSSRRTRGVEPQGCEFEGLGARERLGDADDALFFGRVRRARLRLRIGREADLTHGATRNQRRVASESQEATELGELVVSGLCVGPCPSERRPDVASDPRRAQVDRLDVRGHLERERIPEHGRADAERQVVVELQEVVARDDRARFLARERASERAHLEVVAEDGAADGDGVLAAINAALDALVRSPDLRAIEVTADLGGEGEFEVALEHRPSEDEVDRALHACIVEGRRREQHTPTGASAWTPLARAKLFFEEEAGDVHGASLPDLRAQSTRRLTFERGELRVHRDSTSHLRAR